MFILLLILSALATSAPASPITTSPDGRWSVELARVDRDFVTVRLVNPRTHSVQERRLPRPRWSWLADQTHPPLIVNGVAVEWRAAQLQWHPGPEVVWTLTGEVLFGQGGR